MRINNRDIVLQGSGTINEGSGTPLSVPLTSGGSFNPKIFVQYTLERVDDKVYPFSDTNRPINYILCVYSHVKNYKPGTNEYAYFDAMDKVFYYMIHNDTWNNYIAFKLISPTVRIFTPDNIDLYTNTNDVNGAYSNDLNTKSYSFNNLSKLLNSDNGLHKSDAPLNYLNFFPSDINKIKQAIGTDIDGMIIDTACIKSPKEEYTNTFYPDGFLTKPNCIVSLNLSYPKDYNADIIICNNQLIVEVKAPDRDINGNLDVASFALKYYITGKMMAVLEKIKDLTGNMNVVGSVESDIDGYFGLSSKIIKDIECSSGSLTIEININDSLNNYSRKHDYLNLSQYPDDAINDIKNIISNTPDGTYIDAQSCFRDCNSITSLNISDLDTSKIYKMGSMLSGCVDLESLDLSSWDTSKVIDMAYMFNICQSLTNLSQNNKLDWDVSKVKDMKYMFYGCIALKLLDLSSWDVSNVKDMSYMFFQCQSLESLNISNWNVSNVTNMSYMFRTTFTNCNLLDLSSWNVSNVRYMNHMFEWTWGTINTLILDNWVINANMDSMFYLAKVNNFSMINTDTSNVTNMNALFNSAKINNINIELDLSSCTNITNMFREATITSGSIVFNNVPRSLANSRETFISNIRANSTVDSLITVNFVD